MKQQLEYIDKTIEAQKALKAEQKAFQKALYRCYLELVQNPKTINNLMPWQKNLVHMYAENKCTMMILGGQDGRK